MTTPCIPACRWDRPHHRLTGHKAKGTVICKDETETRLETASNTTQTEMTGRPRRKDRKREWRASEHGDSRVLKGAFRLTPNLSPKNTLSTATRNHCDINVTMTHKSLHCVSFMIKKEK